MTHLTKSDNFRHMMILILKDFYLNYKWFILGVLFVAVWPYLFLIGETNEPLVLANIMSPFISLNIFLGRVLYRDDTYNTRFFLQALPVKKSVRIIAKYFMLLITMLLFMSINVLSMVVVGYENSWHNIVISLSILIIYYVFNFYLFHKYNYDTSNKALIIFFLIFTIGLLVLQNITVPALSINLLICAIVLAVVAIVSTGVSIILSIKNEGSMSSRIRDSISDYFRIKSKK